MESELAAFDFIVGRVQRLLSLAKEQGGQAKKTKKHGLTVAEAAELLGVTAETVRGWIKANRLSATKLPGRAGYRITQQAVDAVLADGGGRPPAPLAETARLLGTIRRG